MRELINVIERSVLLTDTDSVIKYIVLDFNSYPLYDYKGSSLPVEAPV